MFVPIANTPRDYAWGSLSALADLLGTTPSGSPEAELWLGAHPGSPSVIVDPTLTGGATDLAAWVTADPQTTLGRYAPAGRLPFLLKLLAADSPLSLQAHPTSTQAAIGYARENASGIPLDSPLRNYKDAFAKPELIYVLSERFDALCGFRPVDEARDVVAAFVEATATDDERRALGTLLDSLDSEDAPRSTFEWLIEKRDGVRPLVTLVTELASHVSGWDLETATVRALAAGHPGDPGIVISLLLNRVRLTAGQALYLPAGNIHAYLRGVGVELMAASDNVLRGGLTSKHIDIPELLAVLDFATVPVPLLVPEIQQNGIEVFRPDVPDFVLTHASGDGVVSLDGPAILLCTSGGFSVVGARGAVTIARGQAFYATPDESAVHFTGSGDLFLATTGATA